MVTSNIAGHTKKVAMSGLVLCQYSWSNLVGPQLFFDSEEAAGYPTAKKAIAALSVVSLGLTVAQVAYYIFMNKHRDRAYGPAEAHATQSAAEDLTDGENKNFRYAM